MDHGNRHQYRLAELIVPLSLATDLGLGQPMEQSLRTCLLSVALGRQIGIPNDMLTDTYYLALLRFIGCTSDAHEQSMGVGGDEIAFYAGIAPVLMGDVTELLRHQLRHLAADQPLPVRVRLVAEALATGERSMLRMIAVHCEVARMLATQIGLPASIADGIGHIYERWDGKGLPDGLAGDEIPVAVRIVVLARDVDVLHRIGGWALVTERLRKRRARAYDPRLVDVLLADGERWVTDLDAATTWKAVLAAEPGIQITVPEGRLDAILGAFADFADMKTPFTAGHSRGVAVLAEQAARICGLPEQDVTDIRHAALVHDLGRVSIPNGIWEHPGPLSDVAWERVRLHPYYSERMLHRAGPLRRLAALAGAHHERRDGTGYHRGSVGSQLSTAQCILAAADAYQAMTQPRPYRPALSATAAASDLRREVESGRIDRDAANAVLEAAGFAGASSRRSWPAGLTDREVEVLRLICQGSSNRSVAADLHISHKTVGRHVENLYNKIGVSSRAAATLFATQHHLLDS